MKVIQFTVPVQHDKAIVAKTDILPYFYPYLHRHKEMQITWVQDGDGTLIADNNMHTFERNDIFVIGANLPHVFKSDIASFSSKSKTIVSSLDIFFDPEIICNSLLNIPELKDLRSFLQQEQLGFRVPKENIAAVSGKMLRIRQIEDGLARTLGFIELLQILSSLSTPERLASHSCSSYSNENDGIRISHVFNYILHNYEKNITLDDVAQQAFMTPQAFCRFFKKHTRRTFVSFLNEVRINEARKRFSEGNFESISSVAYNCGFNSITNFNRVFKSVTRQAPSSYIETFERKMQSKVPHASSVER